VLFSTTNRLLRSNGQEKMMTRLKISAFALALVACAPLAAFAQGAAGKWDLSVETPQGATTMNVALTQNGDKLAGTLSSPLGEVPMTGTFANGDATVAASIDVQGISLTLTFHGKIAGDTFNGTVQFGEFGEGPFTGKRAAADSAAAPAAAARPAPAAPSAGAASAGAAAGGAGGKWDVVLSLPGAGDFPMTATLTQAGSNVTGTISSAAGGDVAVTGTLTGNALNMKFTAQTPNGDIPVIMTGTLTGNAFAGKASIEGLGEADWTAKRAQQ
jgi:hypothetical protein